MTAFRIFILVICSVVVIAAFCIIFTSSYRESSVRTLANVKSRIIQKTLNQLVAENKLDRNSYIDEKLINLYSWPNRIEIYVAADEVMRDGGFQFVVFDQESEDLTIYELAAESGNPVRREGHYQKQYHQNWSLYLAGVRDGCVKIVPSREK